MSEKKKIARELERQSDIASLKQLYQSAAIGRRAFVTQLAALGISASVAGIIVAGSPVAVAQTPKRGGRMRAARGMWPVPACRGRVSGRAAPGGSRREGAMRGV